MTRSQAIAWGIIVVTVAALVVYVRASLSNASSQKPPTPDTSNSDVTSPTTRAGACTVADIVVKDVNPRLQNDCKTRDCTRIAGTVTIVNRCAAAVGVQVKVTATDSAGRP